MTFKYGDIISLKDGVKPQMSLDAETFFNLSDDDNTEIKTYWGLPEIAFEMDDKGFVYLMAEYAKRLQWGIDAVVRIGDEDNGDNWYNRININVAFDPEGDVNCGAFCSWINEEDILIGVFGEKWAKGKKPENR